MEGKGRVVAGSGTEERTCPTRPRRSLTRTAVCYLGIWPALGPDPWKTRILPIPTRTSTKSLHAWGYDGSHPNQSPLGLRYHTLASGGIFIHERFTSWMRREQSTWWPLRNGRRSACTISSTHRGCTESYCTPHWSSLQGELTSPTWRPCLPLSTTVLSFLTPLHGTPLSTSGGGSNSSAAQPFQGPSQNPATQLTSMHIPTPAQGLVLQSLSAPNGAHGASPQDGSPKAGTSNERKPSASSYLSSAYARLQWTESTYSSMGTTGVSSKAGGNHPVPTSPPTMYSDTSSNYQKIAVGLYTRGTSQVQKTLQMPPPEATTPCAASYLTTSQFPPRSGPSSLMSDPSQLARQAALKPLVRTRPPVEEAPDPELCQLKQHKPVNMRQRDAPLPPTTASLDKRPAPYSTNLTPTPSYRRPHCLARDRLRLWLPATPRPPAPVDLPLSDVELEHIKDTMVHAWEEDMRASYRAGLLMWHCFCDSKQVSEYDRAPVSQTLLSAFVAHMAAAYSGKTVAGYLCGIRAWHLLHGIPWALEKREMDTML